MRKRCFLGLLFCVLVLIVTISAVSATSVSAATTADGFTYSISNGEVTITGYTGSATKVVIPSEIEGYPVTSIGNYAFRDCTSLTSITIPDSVTSIGYYAFQGCTSLTSITIPDSVTSIRGGAFSECTSIKVDENNKVYDSRDNCNAIIETASNTLIQGCAGTFIPDSVTSIGINAFYGCTRLTNITIPDGVTSIGAFAFAYCESLTSITIPESVTSIGDHGFAYCESLTSITIPKHVTSIGEQVFVSCESLASITFPEDIKSIGKAAFMDCESLTSITIPDSVTNIGDSAFSFCSSLVSITIPDGVTSIGLQTFSKCTSLRNITIPDSVTSIGYHAFSSCTNLTSITIPDSVTSIDVCAFLGCKSLTSITIPDSVISIGRYAFEDCTSLTSITISDCVTSIADGVFSKCTSLTSITIPDSVISIGRYAFEDCTSLTSITIPESVTNIGEDAFYYCESLTDVHYKGTKEQWNSICIDYDNGNLTNANIHFTGNCSVVFLDYDGTFLEVRIVKYGGAAKAPAEPVRAGYTFTGWDKAFDCVTEDIIVKAVYKKNATTPVAPATIGSLKVELVGGSSFTISVNGGAARPQGPSYMNTKMPIGATVKVVADTTGTSNFLGWSNEWGAFVSTANTYTFTTTGNDYLKAVYYTSIPGVNVVMFNNDKASGGNGQIIDMQYYAAGDEIIFPAEPSRPGYVFKGWSKTAQDIQTALKAGKNVSVVPVWEVAKVYIDVKVNGGKISTQAQGNGKYLAYNALTVVAGTAPAGQKFAYWTDAKGNIVSYDTTYKSYPAASVELTAVYVSTADTVVKEPLVFLAGDPTVSGEKINYTVSWDVDATVGKITSYGLVIVDANDYNEDTFYHGSGDSKLFDRAMSTSLQKQEGTTIGLGSRLYDHTYYAVAFVIYTDAKTGESVTIYSAITETYKPAP